MVIRYVYQPNKQTQWLTIAHQVITSMLDGKASNGWEEVKSMGARNWGNAKDDTDGKEGA